MKADRARVERALSAPGDIRLFLLHGPDEGGSRALADRLAKALGPDAEQVDLEGSAFSGDASRLAVEAASPSLFGTPRHIRVRVSGDEAAAAVATLFATDQVANPVVILAPALKPTSETLKQALAAPNALVFASYVPEGAEAGRVVVGAARDRGVRLATEAAARIADETGGDRLRIASELDKIALYLDADPERPRDAGLDVVDLLGSDEGDARPGEIVDAALSGRSGALAALLQTMGGEDRTLLLRTLQRRVELLLGLRHRVAAGSSPDRAVEEAGRAVFWKDKPVVTQQLRLWDEERLGALLSALSETERGLRGGAAGPALFDRRLLDLSRAAARRR